MQRGKNDVKLRKGKKNNYNDSSNSSRTTVYQLFVKICSRSARVLVVIYPAPLTRSSKLALYKSCNNNNNNNTLSSHVLLVPSRYTAGISASPTRRISSSSRIADHSLLSAVRHRSHVAAVDRCVHSRSFKVIRASRRHKPRLQITADHAKLGTTSYRESGDSIRLLIDRPID